MWRAQSDPEFVLSGPFKDLVVTTLDYAFEEFFFRGRCDPKFLDDVFAEIEEDPEDLFFIEWHRPFENYSTRDKVVLFARVLRALLEPTVSQPPLSQCYESTMFAIFELIEVVISDEIDNAEFTLAEGGDPYEIRRLASLAEKEHIEHLYGQHIDYTSTDMDHWHEVVDSLANLILWDLDFLESGGPEILADADPDKAAFCKNIFGINTEYYTDTVGLVSQAEFLTAVDYLLQTFNNQ